MSQSRKVAWRKAVVVGWLAASGAVFPLLATAQQNAEQPVPSGAAVEVGGAGSCGDHVRRVPLLRPRDRDDETDPA